MRLISTLMIAAVAATAPAMSAAAKHHRTAYEYNGRAYQSYEACRAAKSRAAKRGTVIGAVAGGAGTALLGGNLGGSLLGAGVGALAGHEIGRSTKKC